MNSKVSSPNKLFYLLKWTMATLGVMVPVISASAEAIGSDTATDFWLGQFFGRLHPMVVHFPISLPDIINDLKNYGMHRHFTDGCSILLFGGGIKRGHVFGKTADERPCKTIENPIKIASIHQTVYHALGITSNKNYGIEKRPFYTTPDGHGKVEYGLLAKS